MKKKIIIIAAACCTGFGVICIIASFTGMLQLYKIPTPSSEPNIKPGEYVFVSNLKGPEQYSFIVFTSPYEDSINMVYMPDYKPGSRYIHRLCGLPGDILEMKNGTLYINSKNFDEKINLNIQYRITGAEFNLIDEDDMIAMEKSGGTYQLNKDSAVVTLDKRLLKKYASTINPELYLLPHIEEGPFKWNNKNADWTTDNFGPLKIPTGCYFVLGDNRHNAMDSRYIGFVKKENIKGVVLNK
jgi:signal peptidase I